VPVRRGVSGDNFSGRLLGEKYILLKPLGRGGMGSVYHGVHRALGKTVAVKVMNVAFEPVKVGENLYSFIGNPYPKYVGLAEAKLMSSDGVFAGSGSGYADQLWGWTGNTFGEQIYYNEGDNDWLAIGSFTALTGLQPARANLRRSQQDLVEITGLTKGYVSKVVARLEGEVGRAINYVVLSRHELMGRVAEGEPFLTNVLAGPKIMLIGEENGLREAAATAAH